MRTLPIGMAPKKNGDLCDNVQEGTADLPELPHGKGNEPWHAYEENDDHVN